MEWVVGAGLRPPRRPRKRRRAIKNVAPASSRLRIFVIGHEFIRAVTNEPHVGLQPLGLRTQIVKLPNRNKSITARINTHRAAINSTQSQPSEILPKITRNQTNYVRPITRVAGIFGVSFFGFFFSRFAASLLPIPDIMPQLCGELKSEPTSPSSSSPSASARSRTHN
jgi:hypothetical protein